MGWVPERLRGFCAMPPPGYRVPAAAAAGSAAVELACWRRLLPRYTRTAKASRTTQSDKVKPESGFQGHSTPRERIGLRTMKMP